MEDGRDPGGGQDRCGLLALSQRVGEKNRCLSFIQGGAARGYEPFFDSLARRKSEDRKPERRLGQKDIRRRSLRHPGRRRGSLLEVARVEKRAPGLLEPDLRGPEDVARRKQRQPGQSGLGRISVSELSRDSVPLRVPPPVERDRLGRRPDLGVPRDRVVRVRVREDRPIHRRRWVQEGPERRSIKTLGRELAGKGRDSRAFSVE